MCPNDTFPFRFLSGKIWIVTIDISYYERVFQDVEINVQVLGES